MSKKRTTLIRTTLIMVAVGTVFLFLGSNPALAETIYVDANCMGAEKGTEQDPFCKIQDAVDDASSGDTIQIAAGDYMENVFIAKNLTLMGEDSGEGSTVVEGSPGPPVILVSGSFGEATVTLSHLTIRGGHSTDGGGGIANFFGTLTVLNSTITGNTGSLGGGGILNLTTFSLNLINSTVSGNTAGFSGDPANFDGGGGILNISGTFTLINSTVSGNTATANSDGGGGIVNGNGTFTLINSTVSGNTATVNSGGGGGIVNANPGVLTLVSSTVTANTDESSFGVGGVLRSGGAIDFTHTIIAANLVGSDCSVNALVSNGYNLDSDGTCWASAPGGGDLTMPPLLDVLADEGGPTATHALLAGSPAIDMGDPGGCTDDLGAPLTTDQRGVARPMDGLGDGTAVCDIGAYEFEAEVEKTTALDHYLSYEVRPSNLKDYFRGWRRNYKKFKVTLDDQFGKNRKFLVLKPETLLNPASKVGEEPFDSKTHLVGYSVFGDWRRRPKEKNIKVKNQFGEILVDLVRADRLLVPASKSEDKEPLDEPILADIHVNHFLCYRVNRSRHTDRFEKREVSVVDQFNENGKSFEVKRPTRLCTPVDKNGEGIKDLDKDLMCYSVKPADGEPKHKRIKGLWVNDQFGKKQVDTRKEQELCIPSEAAVSDGADKPERPGNHHFDRDDDDDDDDDD